MLCPVQYNPVGRDFMMHPWVYMLARNAVPSNQNAKSSNTHAFLMVCCPFAQCRMADVIGGRRLFAQPMLSSFSCLALPRIPHPQPRRHLALTALHEIFRNDHQRTRMGTATLVGRNADDFGTRLACHSCWWRRRDRGRRQRGLGEGTRRTKRAKVPGCASTPSQLDGRWLWRISALQLQPGASVARSSASSSC